MVDIIVVVTMAVVLVSAGPSQNPVSDSISGGSLSLSDAKGGVRSYHFGCLQLESIRLLQ